MTSAQVVETSVNVTNNSPSRDYSHPDDQTSQTPVLTTMESCNLRSRGWTGWSRADYRYPRVKQQLTLSLHPGIAFAVCLSSNSTHDPCAATAEIYADGLSCA